MAATAITTRGTIFAEDAEKAGWEVSLEAEDSGKETVTAKHADSGLEIVMVWDSGRYNYNDSYQSHDGERKTIRNAAEARRILGNATGQKIETTRKITKKVQPTRDWNLEADPVRPAPKRLPFKISSPDRDIIAAVLGKKITWWNEKARRVESARVMANPAQRHLTIGSAKGRRILNWASVTSETTGQRPLAEGFRSVYLENILEVSG